LFIAEAARISGSLTMQAIQMKKEIATVIDADHSAISTECLLFRELSHRINNEFTSLIGVASLIASRSTSDEVKSALSGVADVLHNYAGLHRALQMLTSSTMIEASDYIRALCQSIKRARLDDDDRDIKLVLFECPLRIRSEQCWKLGMILTELITNSTRHAFDDRGGTIQIEMSASGPFAQCCIMDNGSSRGSHRPGQGLRIVDALAKEMSGRIDHRFGAGGAISMLRFPINGGTPQVTDNTWISTGDPIMADAQLLSPPESPPVDRRDDRRGAQP
jgi:two-component sensor histidine kinase